MRDGLLVGTEMFVPGQYTLGGGETDDLRLEDSSVVEGHAGLHFQNGKVAVRAEGGAPVFVNGHRVTTCEVRPSDDIAIGPFSLKVRVVAQKPANRAPSAPPQDIANIFASPTAPTMVARPDAMPVGAKPPEPTAQARGGPPAQAQAPAPAARAPAASARPQAPAAPTARGAPVSDQPTRPVPAQMMAKAAAASASPAPVPTRQPAPVSPATAVSNRRASAALAPVPAPSDSLEIVSAEELVSGESTAAFPTQSHHEPEPAPARPMANKPRPVRAVPSTRGDDEHTQQAPARRHDHGRMTAFILRPRIPRAPEGKGKPRLFVELLWGDERQRALSFGKINPKKPVVGTTADTTNKRTWAQNSVPLWGFDAEDGFVLADSVGSAYRLFIPPNCQVETRAHGEFATARAESFRSDGSRKFLPLVPGAAVRLTGRNGIHLVAYVQAPLPRPFSNPLKGLPWLALFFFFVFGAAFWSAIAFGPDRSSPDFEKRDLVPIAVRLLPPDKKAVEKAKEKVAEEKKKVEDKKPVKKDPVKKPELKQVVQPPPQKKALEAVAKLTESPALKNVMKLVENVGGGPKKTTDFKIGNLIGKGAMAATGIGIPIGVGSGNTPGLAGIAGLRSGKIGGLGVGKTGQTNVSGQVTQATSRQVSAQGNIDKEAVAKVVNSHLQEVRACYERALLKNPGLAGKVTLEWTISTVGLVTTAKTKSSSMNDAAVEGCILNNLKTWKFPPARGGNVVISYPFQFNSVGY